MGPALALLTLLSLLSLQLARSQTIDAAQSSQIDAAINAYGSSLIHGPVATSLVIEVAFDIPSSELSSLASNIEAVVPAPTTNLESFATAPPVTFAIPAWATTLPSAFQADLASLRTSVVLAEASIVRSVLSITATPSIAATASPSSSTTTAVSGASAANDGRTIFSVSAFVVALGVAMFAAVG